MRLAPCGVARSSLSLRLPTSVVNLAVDQNSLARFSKRTIRRCSILSDFVASTPYRSVTVWFQALLTSRQGHFSAFTHATIALSVSGRISGWMSMPPRFTRDIRPALLGRPRITFLAYRYGAVTLFGLGIPPEYRVNEGRCAGVRTPHLQRLSARDSVCPTPSSIAFTEGISIDSFSSPY